ncbi:MAG: transcriptional regulator [Bacteroidetes bacterium CG18_big_fil_WC_8_21_14_2_50_41_14]|nr:MAG: transcriptional regulator [Bacteroidetes bacterium CG18_big_fil_WC_8_21_14_2_50_41_14]PJB58386.1 MAG: transcriptional regulator [Bacteroidetes bacterium CG_4_9_14_3_um_filter_41_19]
MAEKLFYKIGEVADILSVTPSQLRYWEQEFSFLKPKKNDKGTRYYSQKNIDQAQLVLHLLKEKGMTIAGAREYLERRKNDQSLEKLEVISTLKKTKTLLTEIIQLFDSVK